MSDYFVHESSYIDDDVKIGKGTKIWHFSHINMEPDVNGIAGTIYKWIRNRRKLFFWTECECVKSCKNWKWRKSTE